MNIKELKGAEYNPRKISTEKLVRLKKSIERFGDLSGVVFNTRTKKLVTGHQRIKVLKQFKTKIEKVVIPKDGKGTVATGHILVYVDEKSTIKVPYREVDWGNETVEMAANLASNSVSGEWDEAKLKVVLAALAKKKFDVESLNFSLDRNALPPSSGADPSNEESKGSKTYSSFESKFVLIVEFPDEQSLQSTFEQFQKKRPDCKLTVLD